MMSSKGFALCERGLEDISAVEVSELLGISESKIEVEDGVIIFPFEEQRELCKLCYKGHSFKKIGLLLDKKPVEEFLGSDLNIDFSDWIKPDGSFAVRCKRVGDHDLDSKDFEKKIGGLVFDSVEDKQGFEPTVDLDNPDVTIFSYIFGDDMVLGVDFSGVDLSGREYKVFNHPASLKATIAYSVIRLADYDSSKRMLNGMIKGGVLPIEAVLFGSGKSPRYYQKDSFAFWNFDHFSEEDPDDFFDEEDSLISDDVVTVKGVNSEVPNITRANKNAKIAGIDDYVDFARMEPEWFDVKFEKREFDIITASPVSSEVDEIDELFYQGEFLLKFEGKLVIVTPKEIEDYPYEEYGFSLVEERKLSRGELNIYIKVFQKEKEEYELVEEE